MSVDQFKNLNIQEQDEFKKKKSWRGGCALIVVFIITFLAALFGLSVWNQYKKITADDFATDLPLNTLPAGNRQLIETKDSPSWGAADPKVVIVKFGDFECQFCKRVFPILREIGLEYPEDVRFIYRYFLGHPNSQKPAEASQCAYEQGRFLDYHDKLFINQGNNDITSMKRYARELGIKDLKKFDECLDSGQFAKKVQLDYQEAIKLGATATPTIFINGFKVTGALPKKVYVKIIEQILQQKVIK